MKSGNLDPVRASFSRLCDEGLTGFGRMLDERWAENPILDFKCASKNTAPMTDDDIKNYAVALSGFANSEGGIIIWGVDCRKNGADEADTVHALRPISGLKRFESDLQQFAACIVSPGIVGVDHHLVEEAPGSDRGFAVTFVPKGEGEPQMARAKGQHRYYYRAGHSFLIMEPWMLADRYGRRPQPRLELTWRIELGSIVSGPEPTRWHLKLVIGIQNAGRGIARFPGLGLQEHDLFKIDSSGLDGMRRFGLPERPQSPHRRDRERYRFFCGGDNDVIHPGTVLDVLAAEVEMSPSAQGMPDRVLDYELHCDGFSDEGSVLIPGDAFLKIRDDWQDLRLKPSLKPDKTFEIMVGQPANADTSRSSER